MKTIQKFLNFLLSVLVVAIAIAQPVPAVQAAGDRKLGGSYTAGLNLLVNGNFEANPSLLTGWTVAGTASQIDANGYSGQAARLGTKCDLPCEVSDARKFDPISQYLTYMGVDSAGYIHLLMGTTYILRDPQGNWSYPDQPFGVNDPREMVARLDGQDTLHVIYMVNLGIVYLKKPKNGYWSNLEYVVFNTNNDGYGLNNFLMDVDQQGGVHVLYSIFTGSAQPPMYVIRRSPDGHWSSTITLLWLDPCALAAAQDGGEYIFSTDINDGSKGYLTRVYTNGSVPSTTVLGARVWQAASDNQGVVHMAYGNTYTVIDTQGHWIQKHQFDQWSVNGLSFNRDGSVLLVTWYSDYWGNQSQVLFASYADSNRSAADPADFYKMQGDWGSSLNPRLVAAISRKTGVQILSNLNPSITYFYALKRADQNEDSQISQTVTIPDRLQNPALSFDYQLVSLAQMKQSGLTVTLTPQGGDPVTLFSAQDVDGWQQASADLSAYLGQTVTVTFTYHQAAGEPVASLLLDNVNLGGILNPVYLPMLSRP